MKWINILVALLTAGVTPWIVAASEIVVLDSVTNEVQATVSRPLQSMTIDGELLEQNRQIVLTWVSGSIDLNKATKQVHKRFDRTSYRLNTNKEVIRLPHEKLIIKLKPMQPQTLAPASTAKAQMLLPQVVDQPRLQVQQFKVVTLKQPITVLFREGQANFKFHKIKETVALQALSERDAIDAAKQFLVSNKFVQETQDDQIAEVYVQERRSNEEQAGERDRDVLHQQDVVFQRKYQGRPVINSKIVVGLHPDSKDITMFKHYNWTPVQASVVNNKVVPKVKQQLQKPAASAVVRRLQEKIKKNSGTFLRADVKKAMPAWFQTKDAMIPVMAFDVTMEYPSPKGKLTRDYLEVLNLAGSDDILIPELKGVQTPSNAP